jgi:hypothetical protein
MKRKTRKPLTDTELKAKAISRWENEGGALNPASGPPAGGKIDHTKRSPKPASKQDVGSGKPGR